MNFVTTIVSNEYDFNNGGYGIELDKEYLVMGIVVYSYSNCFYYLIDVNGKPTWFPYLLFETVDNSLPSTWFLKLYDPDKHLQVSSILGFDELCNDEDFYDKLIERDEDSLHIYFRNKIDLEKKTRKTDDKPSLRFGGG